ncbi:MAG: PspC domain-containing protein [Cyclobacteriaceae bacterium]|nr:PspC domain-containing protein [Cyclobacteriaceae bacterium]
MKKNISINISGIIFHIEEDGYDILRKYLDSINTYFASYEDNSEILSDIESRIAELFLSKLNEGKQVITKEDVNSLISTMGSVSDFKAAEEQEGVSIEPTKSSEQKESTSSKTTSKKLFRDQKRKILGGICAGLGHYFNIDPVWPRLLLGLLVLGSYGGLLIAYIILWIVLPASDELEESDVKKMFRDSEKKVIGGVASGVAAFFGADLTLIRVLFVVFTFVGGIGFLTYIILWIALPEAKTITEKMQMQGEPVTLSNIESTVKKSINEKDSGDESALAKIILFPFRLIALVINGLAKILGPLFALSVDVLRVGFGVLITMVGIIFLLCLFFIGGVVLGIFSVESARLLWWDAHISGLSLPMEAIRNTFPIWVSIASMVVAIIPALFLTLLGVSVIVKRIVFKPILGWTLFVMFFIGIAVLSFKIPQTIYSFREEGTHRVEESFPIEGKTLVFDIREVGLEDYDVTTMRIIGHDGNDLRIVRRFEAQGPSRQAAINNAQMVTYTIEKNDSIYTFDSNIAFEKDANFRAQRLKVDVYVPYNHPFVIEEYLWTIIDNYGRHFYGEERARNTWKMTTSGLECISCESYSSPATSSSGNAYGLRDFNSVELTGLFNIRIDQGDEFSVEVHGSKRQKEHYNIFTDHETLIIEYDNRNENFFWQNDVFENDKISIDITMPSLRELDAKGAGKIRFRNFQENDVEIKLSGAVAADGKIDAASLEVDLLGASYLDLAGRGSFMDASIAGASGLRAYDYEVDRAVVEAHGASSAKVYVTESLETNKSFASSISHRGGARVSKN